MIVLVGGTKGGCGKSTIATNLAAYLAGEGRKVIIMDTDRQASSARWVERRENPEINATPLPKIHCVQTTGNVYNTALDLEQLYGTVIVDAGGHDSRELRSAMVAADCLYVPMQVSQFDLETLVELHDVITNTMSQNPKLQVYGLVSKAPSNTLTNEVKEARAMLAQFELFTVTDSVIRERKAYRDVITMGRGVVEYTNSKAKAEIQLLAQEIFNANA